jgi:hypothetical protein
VELDVEVLPARDQLGQRGPRHLPAVLPDEWVRAGGAVVDRDVVAATVGAAAVRRAGVAADELEVELCEGQPDLAQGDTVILHCH